MQQVFRTRQFRAGNSPAVRIPAEMAFPDRTELVVIRDGHRIIVEPQENSLKSVPALLARLFETHDGKRPEFIEANREW
jgi:antitoxin VapB